MSFVHTPKTWATETLTSSDLNAEVKALSEGLQEAWDTYTPVRRNGVGGSSLSVGNGSIAGRYIQIGATVKFQIDLVIGTTTALGSTKWTLELPVTPASYASGVGVAYDDTDSARYPFCWDRANLSTDEVVMSAYNGNDVDNNTPVVWADDDRLTITGTYEV